MWRSMQITGSTINCTPSKRDEKQQLRDKFSKRFQQLEAALITLQQTKMEGHGGFKEPKISLLTKFDGTRSQFRGFLNQVRLIIQMHRTNYPTDASRVGLVGSLLSGSAISWFAPLLEKTSPLLSNFEEFIKDFQACF